jgi:hypothetical protein
MCLLLFFYLGTSEQSHCEPDVWMFSRPWRPSFPSATGK